MSGEQTVDTPGERVFHDAVAYAADRTGTPLNHLTRDDFLQAAAIAEASGDLTMTQRLLLLVDDEEQKQYHREE